MTYVRIGLRRSGKLLQMIFCWCKYSFAFQALSSPAPMSFPHTGTSSEVTHSGASPSSPSLSSEGRGGGGGGALGYPRVASRGSSSPPAGLWSGGRGGGACGCSFGVREVASVSSIHSWTGDPGVALLRRTPVTCSVPVGSPSSSLHARRGDGAGESTRAFSVLGCLFRLFYARFVRRGSLPSSAPVGIPPWLLDPQLGKPGRCFEPALFFFFFFFYYLFIYEWEHRTGKMCPFSSLHPLKKGKEV